jgi:hypothetical protein
VLGRVALAAVGLSLLLPAGAALASGAFYPNQLELDRALQAADDYWRHDPQNDCLGRNRGELDTNFPDDHSDAAGYTIPGRCGTIHVLVRRAQTYTRWQFCTLVVHEYGHTIDYEHVDDPTDIMYYKPVTAGLHPKVCDYPAPIRWPRAHPWSAR